MEISINQLKKAKPENVIRLARWLEIDVYEKSIDEVIDLVYWKMKMLSFLRGKK